MTQRSMIVRSDQMRGWRDAWGAVVAGLDQDALRLRFFSASRHAASEFCRTSNPDLVLIVFVDGTPVAAADIHVTNGVMEMGICVSKNHRGRGIGGDLLDVALTAPPPGARSCALCYLAENKAIGKICRARSARVSRCGEICHAEIALNQGAGSPEEASRIASWAVS